MQIENLCQDDSDAVIAAITERGPARHHRREPGVDRRQLGQGGRPARRRSASSSSWSWWCSSSGPTSASGRCRWPRWSRWPTTSLITIGVYALSGFPVTPSAVTGLLAILGFSMYDTVVVFDKVRENTHELRRTGAVLRPGHQPGGQPDPGPLDQHLDRRAHPDRRDPLRQRRPARRQLAEGPRARAVRRHGRRCLLLDLHRPARAGAAEVEREGGHRTPSAAPRRGPAATPTATPPCPAFTEDLPVARRGRPRARGRRRARRRRRARARRAAPRPRAPPRPPVAAGRPERAAARCTPERRPSGRAQPTRQPRSKRGKK